MSSLTEHHFVGDLIATFTFDIVVIENTKQNSTTQIPHKNENKIKLMYLWNTIESCS